MSKAKFVPFEKLSKKQKREINNQKRNTWTMNPETRIVPSKKIYNRKKVESYAD